MTVLGYWLNLAVSFVSYFVITAGSTVGGAMVGSGETTMPATTVWVLACVMGLVSASRRVQAMLAIPPTKAVKENGK